MCRRIFKEQTSESGDIPFYKIGTFGGQPDAYISRELFAEYKAKYPYPKEGDILLSASGSIGRTVEFSGKNEYFQDSNIVWLSHDDNLDNAFLKCFYSIVKWAGIEGSTIKRLYNDNILNTKIILPSVDEQKQIGAFFKELDTLITLHQRESYKYSLCHHDLSDVLECLLTIYWEQRKLGELVQFSKGAGYSKGDLKESGTPIILYGRLYTKYETVIADVDTFADAKNGSVYSRGGEVIVPASGETAEDISIASVVEKQGILLGGDLNIITPPADLDSAFLAISISNGKPHEDMSKMAQGKSVVHLHNTDLEKIDMTYPSHEEQTQISDLFRRIDNLITLHQRKSPH